MQRETGGGKQRTTTQVQGWLERAADAALPISSIECNGNTLTPGVSSSLPHQPAD